MPKRTMVTGQSKRRLISSVRCRSDGVLPSLQPRIFGTPSRILASGFFRETNG